MREVVIKLENAELLRAMTIWPQTQVSVPLGRRATHVVAHKSVGRTILEIAAEMD
jgi:hypothetical protein